MKLGMQKVYNANNVVSKLESRCGIRLSYIMCQIKYVQHTLYIVNSNMKQNEKVLKVKMR